MSLAASPQRKSSSIRKRSIIEKVERIFMEDLFDYGQTMSFIRVNVNIENLYYQKFF